MSLLWLTPVAFAGLAALAIPLAAHLLTRRERQPLVFPSLRFLEPTRLSAIRPRRLNDILLLLVRLATVLAAVAALASPVLVTSCRERQWDANVVRAIVLVTPGVAAADGGRSADVDAEAAGAWRAKVFDASGSVRDVLPRALEWLDAQPRAMRELVFAGDLREGAVSAQELSAVPAETGVRFLPRTDAPVDRQLDVAVLTRRADRAVVVTRKVTLDADGTRVATADADDGGTPRVSFEVRAPEADRQAAEAALAAALDMGVVAGTPERRQVIAEWGGADSTADQVPLPEAWMRKVVAATNLAAYTEGEALVVRMTMAPGSVEAVHALRAAARAAFAVPGARIEPNRIPAADLAALSRPARAPVRPAPPPDTGDRRVLWGAVLVLLLVETLLRRSVREEEARPAAAGDEGTARVA